MRSTDTDALLDQHNMMSVMRRKKPTSFL